jgi:hypothetical protein
VHIEYRSKKLPIEHCEIQLFSKPQVWLQRGAALDEHRLADSRQRDFQLYFVNFDTFPRQQTAAVAVGSFID